VGQVSCVLRRGRFGPGLGVRIQWWSMLVVAVFFMRVLEVAFFAGIAGSAVVVVISFVEDVHELLGD
jgi:hypothetical protein